jgi:hypothetical protein
MAPIRRANTNRRSRRYDPLGADAAFADAFDEAHQDHFGHESDVNVEDAFDNQLPTDPALYTDHDNHDGTAHLRDDDDDSTNGQVAAADAAETPGQRLEHLRQNFNPQNVLRASKATSTFNKHKSNNERFILYLFENKPDLLHTELAEALQDIDAEIDYSRVVSSHRRFQRNGGTKSIEECKAMNTLMESTDVCLCLGGFHN